MQIEIKENVNRPAWNSRSLRGTGKGTVRLPGTCLGLDDTVAHEWPENETKVQSEEVTK